MRQLLTFTFLTVALYANSGGPGQGYANNAPNFNNCTSCHNGTQNSGDGSVFLQGFLTVMYLEKHTLLVLL